MSAQTKTVKITVKVIDQSGKTNDYDITSLFSSKDLLPTRENFVHQILLSYLDNQRQATAKVKSKAEVSGGGRKPWKQKGTGRSRHGSTRSPLWRHGGVSFGPTGEQNFHRDIPLKMKHKALRFALLDCWQNNCLIVVDDFDRTIDSTKKMRLFLEKLPIARSNLVIFSPELLSLSRFTDNLDFVRSKSDNLVNALDIFQARTVILSKESLKNILTRSNPAHPSNTPTVAPSIDKKPAKSPRVSQKSSQK